MIGRDGEASRSICYAIGCALVEDMSQGNISSTKIKLALALFRDLD